jgi:hypothetical protein
MAATVDMDALEHEHTALIQKIMATNGDLGSRMATLGVTSEYDVENDILFVAIGAPVAALTETIDNWIGLRVDPVTLKLVGLEILGARANAPSLAILTTRLLLLLAVTQWPAERRSEPVPVQLYEDLAASVRELATAA